MDYKSVNTKSLKFKGTTSKGGGIKKKKRSSETLPSTAKSPSLTGRTKASTSDPAGASQDPLAQSLVDSRTPAQRKFDEIRRIRQEKEIEKTASMSHQERIEAMNTHLSKLTEVNDLPKIGPG